MLDKNSTLFIMGAPDPEAKAIEELLEEHGYQYAMCMSSYNFNSDKERVNSHAAYKTKILCTSDRRLLKDFSKFKTIILVECNGDFVLKIPCNTKIIKVDHHNEGDVGWNGGPEKFLESSSIGQVLDLLNLQPTKHHLLIAAGDHCLAAAYNGKCKDIDPVELLIHRLTNRALYSKIDPKDLNTEVQKLGTLMECAIAEIHNARTITINGETFADFTYRKTVPLLGEAASYLGYSIISCKFVRDMGRYKYMVQSMNPEVIEYWIGIMADKMGLDNIYGAPKRGYAGGYRDTMVGT